MRNEITTKAIKGRHIVRMRGGRVSATHKDDTKYNRKREKYVETEKK
jgi:hypothetical protein